MAPADDHLPSAAVEDLDGLALGSTDWILRVDLGLEAADLTVLIRRELELELQAPSVVGAPDDPSALKGVEVVLADLVDGGWTIEVDGKDAPVLGAGAKTHSSDAGVIAEVSEREAL